MSTDVSIILPDVAENMVVQFWTIIAVPTSGHDSARCGGNLLAR
ncbi:MAG: hypothetical protein WAX10_02830 [Leuconostoc citreum]